MKSTDFRNS